MFDLPRTVRHLKTLYDCIISRRHLDEGIRRARIVTRIPGEKFSPAKAAALALASAAEHDDIRPDCLTETGFVALWKIWTGEAMTYIKLEKTDDPRFEELCILQETISFYYLQSTGYRPYPEN